ncbi:hypothetical protein [Mucisphaera calidilacus]|uniref:Uncharacterized protein n=1 Tax=Mucisphaera calidilacus TaxID=2527982 RepID=A0A518BTN1_9BACT|nr:hypothetical protein [Mucisphaera calidilacus]QDU70331.1 hypothetical protein Pan265_01560 [Mucisphaera calidilacus]
MTINSLRRIIEALDGELEVTASLPDGTRINLNPQFFKTDKK